MGLQLVMLLHGANLNRDNKMAVYVDSENIKYRNMTMNHMLADSDEELIAMAKKIGVQVKWHQYPGTIKSHFDICLVKKKLAIQAGAIEISRQELANILKKRRENLLT